MQVTARPSVSASVPSAPAASVAKSALVGGGIGAATGLVASAALGYLAYMNGAHHFADLAGVAVFVYSGMYAVPGGAALGALIGGVRAARS